MRSETSIFKASSKETGRGKDFINVAAYLPKMARQQPDALAVAIATGHRSEGKACYEMLTFAELNHWSDRAAH